jgi:hypothetical protein
MGEALALVVARRGLAAVDTETGELLDFRHAIVLVPWRNNSLARHEPRMPPHQYCIVANLTEAQTAACRVIEFLIDNHPETYLAYFRGYRRPLRYLEWDGMRYWRSKHRNVFAVNRCRLDATEPPRRVDDGGKPIPPKEWGSRYPFWPQGSGYGDWRWERGRWVFYSERELGAASRQVEVDSEPGASAAACGLVVSWGAERWDETRQRDEQNRFLIEASSPRRIPHHSQPRRTGGSRPSRRSRARYRQAVRSETRRSLASSRTQELSVGRATGMFSTTIEPLMVTELSVTRPIGDSDGREAANGNRGDATLARRESRARAAVVVVYLCSAWKRRDRAIR